MSRLSALFPALALILAPAAADAHAVIVASTPAPKAQVAGPDVAIELDFNSRIDKARSKVGIVGSDNVEQKLDIVADGEEGRLATKASGLAPGPWRIRWQVLSVDGHITRGEIPFTVGTVP